MSRWTATSARQVLEPSLLRPEATSEDVDAFCRRAVRDRFATIRVGPHWAARAVRNLVGEPVRVGTVAGFPFGGADSATKLFEIDRALEAGARDIDLVLAPGALRSREDLELGSEVRHAADAVHAVSGRRLAVVAEVGFLTPEQIVRAAHLAADAGADELATGAGYGPRGVTPEDVRALRRATRERIRLRATGEIDHAEPAVALLRAGADRIGSARAFEILAEVEFPGGGRVGIGRIHAPSAQAIAGHLDDVR